MTDKEKYEEALQHLADNHCVLVDTKDIREPSYCWFLDDEDMTCEKCWAWYIESGSWWNHEREPDYDRKWKEMHGE